MRTKCVGFLSVFFVAIAFSAVSLHAQSGTLAGTVLDSDTGQPVSGAQLQVQGGGLDTGGLSNQQGRFSFSVPPGSYTVTVTFIGYRSWTRSGVSVAAGEPTTVEVRLVSDAVALNPIVVTAGRKAEKRTEAPATTHVVGTTEIAERPSVTPVEHLRSSPGVDIITQERGHPRLQ